MTTQLVQSFALEADVGTLTVTFGGSWQADIRFREVDDKLVISQLVIEPIPGTELPKGGVTADLLRDLKLGEAHIELRNYVAERAQEDLDATRTSLARMEELKSGELAGAVEDLPPGRKTQLARDEFISLSRNVNRILKAEPLAAASVLSFSSTKRRDDEFYSLVALQYLALSQSGIRRGIITALRDVLTEINDGVRPEYNQVKGWVQTATRRELLGPGHQGSAGRNEGKKLGEECRRLWPEYLVEHEETP